MEQQANTEHAGIIGAIKRKPKLIAAALLLALVAVILAVFIRSTPKDRINASGMIEATEVTLSSKVLAKVAQVTAEEGDSVRAGELLVRLDPDQYADQVRQAQGALGAAQARYREALNGARPEQVEQARAQVAQAEASVAGARRQLSLAEENFTGSLDLSGRLEIAQTQYNASRAAYQRALDALEVVKQGARKDQIEQARAAVTQVQALANEANLDLQRAQKLFDKGAIPASQLDSARTASKSSQAQLDQAKARLADLEAGATPAEISQAQAAVAQAKAEMDGAAKGLRIAREQHAQKLTPSQQLASSRTQYVTGLAQLQGAKARLLELLNGTRPEQVDAAFSQVEQARAAVGQARTFLDSTSVESPISGAVITRAVEPGDLATIGSTLMVLADLTRIQLKVYVEEPVYGRIKLGQSADVTVDSYPTQVFKGRVTEIAQQAEFTPKEIQTPEQRAKLVFAVKITIPNVEGKLKPGMPADALLRLQPLDK